MVQTYRKRWLSRALINHLVVFISFTHIEVNESALVFDGEVGGLGIFLFQYVYSVFVYYSHYMQYDVIRY